MSESHRMSFNKSLRIHLPSMAISMCRASPIQIHNLPSIIASLNSFLFTLPPRICRHSYSHTNRGHKQFFYHFSMRARSRLSAGDRVRVEIVSTRRKTLYEVKLRDISLKADKTAQKIRVSSPRWQIEQNIIVLYSMEHFRDESDCHNSRGTSM